MDRSIHIAVIGAGIVGSSTAYYLTRAGFKVTLIDRNEPGSATSFGNAGAISPSNITPFSYPGVARNLPGWLLTRLGPVHIPWQKIPHLTPWLYRYWRSGKQARMLRITAAIHRLMQPVQDDWTAALTDTQGQHFMNRSGGLAVYKNQAALESSRWAYDLKAEYGFRFRELSGTDIREREPALRVDDDIRVVEMPDWAHIVDPRGVTDHLAKAAFAAGARWLNDSVTSVKAQAENVALHTESGSSVHADRLVVAAGVWSNSLIQQLESSVPPLAAKRGYHITLSAPNIQLNQPLLIGELFYIATPMAMGLRMAGTAEFNRIDAPPDYRRARALLECTQRYLPGLKGESTSEWMGQRPMTPDSLPVIGVSPRHDNVFYATGHGHYGLTQGPTTGRILAALNQGEDPGLDLEPYRFNRF